MFLLSYSAVFVSLGLLLRLLTILLEQSSFCVSTALGDVGVVGVVGTLPDGIFLLKSFMSWNVWICMVVLVTNRLQSIRALCNSHVNWIVTCRSTVCLCFVINFVDSFGLFSLWSSEIFAIDLIGCFFRPNVLLTSILFQWGCSVMNCFRVSNVTAHNQINELAKYFLHVKQKKLCAGKCVSMLCFWTGKSVCFLHNSYLMYPLIAVTIMLLWIYIWSTSRPLGNIRCKEKIETKTK